MNEQQSSYAVQPCTFCSVVGSISDWMQHPFSPQGTAFQWWLTVGLLLVAIWFWSWTLLMLREEI